jgi:excinuclease ABC subunit A
MFDTIKIRGARTNNLKNIDIDIPKNTLTVITGLSGSGKSSLAFDTIYAEGQRRYVENLSTYAKQVLGILNKPDIDSAEGLSPAIAIDQKSISRSPRSTVGTLTEIYDYLRLLFARIGQPHCPVCHKPLIKNYRQEIVNRVFADIKDLKSQIQILTPIAENEKVASKLVKIIQKIKTSKYANCRIDAAFYSKNDLTNFHLDPSEAHNIEVVVDSFDIEELKNQDGQSRLRRSIEKTLVLGSGKLAFYYTDSQKYQGFSENYTCPNQHITLPEINPRLFSFNSPQGACQDCHGLGLKKIIDPNLVIPNQRLTLAEGAIRPWARMTNQTAWYDKTLKELSERQKFSLDIPVDDLSDQAKSYILYGDDTFEGVVKNLERRYLETDSEYLRTTIEKYMVEKTCQTCSGRRLRIDALSVLINGQNITDISSMSISEAQRFFQTLKCASPDQINIAKPIIQEIITRLNFLEEVGLSYLSLNRQSDSLAGGEAQRIRLATQLCGSLSGVIYILDEPSIGLHPSDTTRLIATLKILRDKGNTVIVVEHDEAIIKAADYIIDIGPLAGVAGGEVVAAGNIKEVLKSKKSLTAAYLTHQKTIAIAPKRRIPNRQATIEIKGANGFNLKNIDVTIPTGLFVGVTGVSGSGKSTLIYEILGKKVAQHFYRAKAEPGQHKTIKGLEFFNKAINIDQSPIGRTPRSNLATYTGLFGPIRELFAAQSDAKLKGFTLSHFSFNLKGGRCEACHGDGLIKVEMHFLPDIYVTCEECHGKRYNGEALEITFKEKTIADILDMTVDTASEFFKDEKQIIGKLRILQMVGLGYVPLGQSATTLSGGEAQRIKLATELSRNDTGQTLYILDEPTTGLHFEDTAKLLAVLQKLVDKGNTVLVIEHNLDVIKSADYLIDLGPGGGDQGGEIVATGTPEQVARVTRSLTGQYLRKALSIKS